MPLVLGTVALGLATSAVDALGSKDLAVLINTRDPLSTAIGACYMAKRHIPRSNVARVSFDPSRDELPADTFRLLRKRIERQIDPRVQAYALTWARPYRVGCMSITAAFAFGYDPKYCASGCHPTQRSPYLNSPSTRPYDDLHIRPTMSLAATSLRDAKQLIDRGIAADGTLPAGTAYLAVSDDAARNVRAAEYPWAAAIARGRIKVEEPTGAVHDRPDEAAGCCDPPGQRAAKRSVDASGK